MVVDARRRGDPRRLLRLDRPQRRGRRDQYDRDDRSGGRRTSASMPLLDPRSRTRRAARTTSTISSTSAGGIVESGRVVGRPSRRSWSAPSRADEDGWQEPRERSSSSSCAPTGWISLRCRSSSNRSRTWLRVGRALRPVPSLPSLSLRLALETAMNGIRGFRSSTPPWRAGAAAVRRWIAPDDRRDGRQRPSARAAQGGAADHSSRVPACGRRSLARSSAIAAATSGAAGRRPRAGGRTSR